MVNLKTTFSDGDVFSSGTTASDDALNGITNEVNRKGVIHRKVYSSAAEVSVTGNFADTAKTFDLTAPIGSVITKITMKCNLKSSGGVNNNPIVNIKINGTNLGTKYITRLLTRYNPGVPGYDNLFTTYTTTKPEAGLTVEHFIIASESTSYDLFGYGGDITENLEIADTTTTFTVILGNRGSGDTSYLKNVVIEVIYVENIIEDA